MASTEGFIATEGNVYYKHVEGKGCLIFVRYDAKPWASKNSKDPENPTMLLASAGGGIRLPNGVRVQLNAMMPKATAGKTHVEAKPVDLSDLLK